MTLEKAERYRKISAKAGIVCSCFVILVFLCALTLIIAQSDKNQEWVGVVGFAGYFGAISSALICLFTAIVSRNNPNQGAAPESRA
jgi:Na+/melibiose symporter-like transporter